MDRRLIDHFVNANVLSRQDMQRVILRASKDKTGLVTQLLDAGLIEDELLAEEISEFYQYELLDSGEFYVDHDALALLTGPIARKAGALAYGFEPGTERVYVALFDPHRARDVLEMLESATGQPSLIRVAPRRWLERAIPYYYDQQTNGGEERFVQERTVPDMRAMQPGRANARTGEFGHGDQPHSDIHRLPSSGASSRSGRSRPGRSTPGLSNPGLSNPGRSNPGLSNPGRSNPGRSNPGRSRGSISRPGRSAPPTSSSSIDTALDEFDDFLNDEEPILSPRASFAGRPPTSGSGSGSHSRPGRGQDPGASDFGDLSGGPAFWESEDDNNSRWGWDDDPGPEPPKSGDDFSLFDAPEPPPSDREKTLREIVEMHHDKIRSLKKEAQRQRQVIRALADLLVEARVISRRDLTRRLKKMRDK